MHINPRGIGGSGCMHMHPRGIGGSGIRLHTYAPKGHRRVRGQAACIMLRGHQQSRLLACAPKVHEHVRLHAYAPKLQN